MKRNVKPKDTAVTAHPTIKTSTIYALELIAEERQTTIGRALEFCLEDCKLFTEKRDIYKS